MIIQKISSWFKYQNKFQKNILLCLRKLKLLQNKKWRCLTMKEYYDSFKIMNTPTKSKVLIIIDLAYLLLKKANLLSCFLLILFNFNHVKFYETKY
jgi:hypothetical protein